MPAEQRKWPRKVVPADGCLYGLGGELIGPCRLVDVSAGGAKLQYSSHNELPTEFFLLLSRNGQVRRRCRSIWREQDHIGVSFVESTAA